MRTGGQVKASLSSWNAALASGVNWNLILVLISALREIDNFAIALEELLVEVGEAQECVYSFD